MQKVKVVVQNGQSTSRGNWTRRDDDTLIRMYEEGNKYGVIGTELNRSYNSISARVAKLKKQGRIIDECGQEDFQIVEESDTLLNDALNRERKEHRQTKLLLELIQKELFRLKELD